MGTARRIVIGLCAVMALIAGAIGEPLSWMTMNLLRTCLAFSRRRATRLALVAGLFTAAVCWWWLPPSPRQILPLSKAHLEVILSPDFRYAAVLRETPDEYYATVWKVEGSEQLFSFPFQNDPEGDWAYSNDLAIAPDNDFIVELARGKARFRKIPSGELWERPGQVEFHHNREKWISSRLGSDARGRLLVIVEETTLEGVLASVRDLLSGETLANCPLGEQFDRPEIFPGGIVYNFGGKVQVLPLPAGTLLPELQSLPSRPRADYDAENENEDVPLLSMDSWALTPDCKHLAFVRSDKIYTWNTATGKGRKLPVTIGEILLHSRGGGGCGGIVDIRKCVRSAAISPDGRYLTFKVRRDQTKHEWLTWLRSWIGLDSPVEEFILFDLIAGTEAATLPTPRSSDFFPAPVFSSDGRSLAVESTDKMEFYDFPLRRPWANIVICSLIAAAAVWLLAWFFGRRSRAA